jgi:hypothetical protein
VQPARQADLFIGEGAEMGFNLHPFTCAPFMPVLIVGCAYELKLVKTGGFNMGCLIAEKACSVLGLHLIFAP